MNGQQPFMERITELASVTCGCGMALGLLILGTCAGAVTNSVSGVAIGVTVVVSLVIVALVFLLTKKNRDLRVARAQLDAMKTQPDAPRSTGPDSQTLE